MAVGMGGKDGVTGGFNGSRASGSRNSGGSSSSGPGNAGGNSKGGGLGITTGKTWHGNTAFGPAGGMATGYATNSRLGSGMGPSVGSFSNFRNLDGSAMIGGGLQNRAIAARNPQQALGMLRALQGAQGSQRPSGGRVGGHLDGEDVTVGPTTVVPAASAPAADAVAAASPPLALGMMRYGSPAYPGAYTPAQLSQIRAQYSSWDMRNPTQRAYNPATSPITLGRAGTVTGGPSAISSSLSASGPSAWNTVNDSISRWMGNGMTYRGD